MAFIPWVYAKEIVMRMLIVVKDFIALRETALKKFQDVKDLGKKV